MGRLSWRWQALVLALAAAPLAHAQLSNLPNLSTATQTSNTAQSTSGSTAESTSGKSTSAPSTSGSSNSASSSQTTTTATFGTASPTASAIVSLSGLPTIAGAGIPSLVIPYTANAPFMQKSNLPEGTVFIAVGAVLAFLGACVLLWRGLVTWSVHRSVKRAAIASIRGGSEKTGSTWGAGGGASSTGYNPLHNKNYREMAAATGSVMSLDALTSTGKHMRSSHGGHPFRDHEPNRRTSTPPSNLFFSPTAAAAPANRDSQHLANNRNSSYLPAGYYASPSSAAAGGAGATTIGASVNPYAPTRHSALLHPSPPSSPGLASSTRSTAYRASSRDGLRAPSSRDGLRAPRDSRDGYGSARNSYVEGTATGPSGTRQGYASGNGLYAQPSSSSLMVGIGGPATSATTRSHSADDSASAGPAGSRAPSAYLEDLFEGHNGNVPRER